MNILLIIFYVISSILGWLFNIYLLKEIKNSVPVGTIMTFTENLSPDNFLLCNGQKLLKKKYKDLFNIIGNNYSEDSTDKEYFFVPNLVNKDIKLNYMIKFER